MFTRNETIILEKAAAILERQSTTGEPLSSISCPGAVLSFLARCRRSGLPALHVQAIPTMERESPSSRCAEDLPAHRGEIVIMCGPSGVGKTQTAVAAAAKIVLSELWSATDPRKTVAYFTARNFFATCRAGFRDNSSESDTTKLYTKPYMLILDEIGEGSGTPYEMRTLTSVIDARYSDQKITILLGNTRPDAISQLVGPSVASRVRERGLAVDCTLWPNFRSGKKSGMKKLNYMDPSAPAAPTPVEEPEPTETPTPTASARRIITNGDN